LANSVGALFASILLVLATVLVAPAAHAQDDDAAKIQKAISDYMGSQKSISLSFDTDIEVITPEIQKLQFASSGKSSAVMCPAC
jgi:hypothetical protein